MIRVLLVDDHAIVRQGLEQLLAANEDIDVVATATDGDEAVEAYRPDEVDLTLMDLEMPHCDGIQATKRLVDRNADARVVILTSFADRERILDALDAGAVGYLLKDAEPDELVRGIRTAAAGESPLAPRAATELLHARRERRPETALSEREQEVLKLLGGGLPNKLIALRLGIAEKTVKAHVTRIFQVLGVTDRTQAALWVQRNRA